MNRHLTESDLVLHFYRDDEDHAAAEQHLASCATCQAAFAQLSDLLGVVKSAPAPEPLNGLEQRVWTKVHGRILGTRRPWWSWIPVPGRARQWAYAGGIAAVIALAFFAGRFSPRDPAEQAVVSPHGNVRERILLVTVADHLERSQLMLLELVNAGDEDSLVLRRERERAANLLADNRIFRLTAESDGDHATVAVLNELERILMEVENAPDSQNADELGLLRAAIENKDLLLKVRVVGSQARDRLVHPRRDTLLPVI